MDLNSASLYYVKWNDEEKTRVYEAGLGVTLFTYMKKYKNRILQYIADTGETDTYKQVLTKSIRTALKLKENGIGKNDIIGTCSHNQKNSYVASIAAFFLGAIPVNFDPNLSHLDTIHLLKLIQPKIIFVSVESVPFMEKCFTESKVATELVVLGDSKKYSQFSEYLEYHPDEGNFQPAAVDDNKETAIIMFSSGTTGFPKGICLSHRAVIGILNENNRNTTDKQSINLGFSTLYWISGVKLMIVTITNGDAQVVWSKFDPYEAWRIIEKYKVNRVVLATHLGYDLLRHRPKNVDISSLQLVTIGGSSPTKELMEGYRVALSTSNTFIVNVYAQTEAAGVICLFNLDKPEDVEMLMKKPLSCGKVRQGIMWKVVNLDNEQPLGPNNRGEMRIKCDTIMNGYYKMDSSTAFDSEWYFKTGDIVYYDDDQCFYVVDRVKDIFKYKGWHILPNVLEDVLLAHPAIKEAVVIGIPHEIDGEHPMGIVVLHEENQHVTPMEIQTFFDERVPEIQRLRAGVKIVKELLRTATGKIRRKEFRKMVLEGKI